MTYRWDTSSKDLRRVRVGKAKCSRCEGEGKYVDYEDTVQATYFRRCERCGGKGYVEEEVVGESINYTYVDGAVKIVPDTPKPDSEAIKEIRFLRAALEEKEREVERIAEYRCAVARVEHDAYARTRATFSAAQVSVILRALEEREREVERLREELRVTRMERDHAWEN